MPISVQVGSSTYWLQSNGTWTQDQGGKKPLTGSALTAAQQAYSSGGGTGGPGTAGGGSGTPTGPLAGLSPAPVGAPTPIMSQALSYNGRFGNYTVPSYQIGTSYAGPENPGGGNPVVPAPAPPAGTPSPSPAPSPAPTPAPSPAPSPVPGGGQGGRGPFGAGGFGGPGAGGFGGGQNQGAQGTGGAPGGGNGGGGFLGGLFGGSGGNQSAASPNSGAGMLNIGQAGSGLLDLGSIGAGLLGAAGHIPGPVGFGFGAANLLGRAYNTYQTDNIRQQQGIPGLSVGQALSGLTGIGGGYGGLGGDATIANPQQFTDRINPGLQAMESTGLYSRLNPQYAETLNGDPYNSFKIGQFNLGTNTPAFSYNDASSTLRMLDSLKNPAMQSINPQTGMPGWMTPTDWNDLYGAGSYSAPKGAVGGVSGSGSGSQAAVAAGTQAPSSVATSQKTSESQGTPITRGDGTVIGYMKPNGTADSAAAQNALNSGAAGYGVGGKMATTAAMGGGYGGAGSNSTPGGLGGGIGSGTGINGGGQGDRSGFRRGGFVPGQPDNIPDDRPINADEGEFVVRKSAAKAAGSDLLAILNDPKMAGKLRILARQGGILR